MDQDFENLLSYIKTEAKFPTPDEIANMPPDTKSSFDKAHTKINSIPPNTQYIDDFYAVIEAVTKLPSVYVSNFIKYLKLENNPDLLKNLMMGDSKIGRVDRASLLVELLANAPQDIQNSLIKVLRSCAFNRDIKWNPGESLLPIITRAQETMDANFNRQYTAADIHRAAATGNIAEMEKILAKQPDLEKSLNAAVRNNSLAMTAVCNGQLGVLQWLCERDLGCLRVLNENGVNCLDRACIDCNLDIINFILKNDSKCGSTSITNQYVQVFCSKKDITEKIKALDLLLEYQVDCNQFASIPVSNNKKIKTPPLFAMCASLKKDLSKANRDDGIKFIQTFLIKAPLNENDIHKQIDFGNNRVTDTLKIAEAHELTPIINILRDIYKEGTNKNSISSSSASSSSVNYPQKPLAEIKQSPKITKESLQAPQRPIDKKVLSEVQKFAHKHTLEHAQELVNKKQLADIERAKYGDFFYRNPKILTAEEKSDYETKLNNEILNAINGIDNTESQLLVLQNIEKLINDKKWSLYSIMRLGNEKISFLANPYIMQLIVDNKLDYTMIAVQSPFYLQLLTNDTFIKQLETEKIFDQYLQEANSKTNKFNHSNSAFLAKNNEVFNFIIKNKLLKTYLNMRPSAVALINTPFVREMGILNDPAKFKIYSKLREELLHRLQDPDLQKLIKHPSMGLEKYSHLAEGSIGTYSFGKYQSPGALRNKDVINYFFENPQHIKFMLDNKNSDLIKSTPFDYLVRAIKSNVITFDRYFELLRSPNDKIRNIIKIPACLDLLSKGIIRLQQIEGINNNANFYNVKTLKDLISGRLITFEEALSISEQSAFALIEARNRNAVHNRQDIINIVGNLTVQSKKNVYEDKQTTHTKSIHDSATNSAIKLAESYEDKLSSEEEIDNIITSLIKNIDMWQQANKVVSQKYHGNVINCLPKAKVFFEKNIIKDGKPVSLFDGYAKYIDQKSKISFKKLLALAYVAIQDESKNIATFDDSFALLIEGIYEIMNIYNLSNPNANRSSCTSGAFNKILEKLTGVHNDVQLVFVTPETVTEKILIVYKNKLVEIASKASNQDAIKNHDEDYILQLFNKEVAEELKNEIKSSYNDISIVLSNGNTIDTQINEYIGFISELQITSEDWQEIHEKIAAEQVLNKIKDKLKNMLLTKDNWQNIITMTDLKNIFSPTEQAHLTNELVKMFNAEGVDLNTNQYVIKNYTSKQQNSDKNFILKSFINKNLNLIIENPALLQGSSQANTSNTTHNSEEENEFSSSSSSKRMKPN